MPIIIKVYILPQIGKMKLILLHDLIVDAVVSVLELDLRKDQDPITVIFPNDALPHRRKKEAIIEVTGLFIKPDRTPEVCQKLATKLGHAVMEKVSAEYKVECFIHPFDPENGFWWGYGIEDP